MSTVREILLARKAEIEIKLSPLHEECSRLRRTLAEKEDEVSILYDESKQIDFALKALDEAQAKTGHLTIMQAVLEVLKLKPDGMTSQEILAEINTRYFDGSVVRPSLSPQLSRLKDRDKKIELRSNRWFLLPEEPTLFRRRI